MQVAEDGPSLRFTPEQENRQPDLRVAPETRELEAGFQPASGFQPSQTDSLLANHRIATSPSYDQQMIIRPGEGAGLVHRLGRLRPTRTLQELLGHKPLEVALNN